MAARLSARHCSFSGVGGKGEVPAWSVAEGFAEEEIPQGFVVEEEPREASPGEHARPSVLEMRR
jgi:hypothetical protein